MAGHAVAKLMGRSLVGSTDADTFCDFLPATADLMPGGDLAQVARSITARPSSSDEAALLCDGE